MAQKPIAGQTRDLVERARLFEQMRRSRHDDELLFATEAGECASVQLDNLDVVFSDNKQRGSSNARQRATREIGPATSRDDRTNREGTQNRRHQCGGSAGAGAEVTDPKVRSIGRLTEPVGRRRHMRPAPLSQILALRAFRKAVRCRSAAVQCAYRSNLRRPSKGRSTASPAFLR